MGYRTTLLLPLSTGASTEYGETPERRGRVPVSPAVARRKRTLSDLESRVFDVVVVGGGSVGAGIACEASAQGLDVALLERSDFGSGTSSRSTKLIHGGVRYLEKAVTRLDRVEFDLVTEALAERAAFFRTAPFLAKSLAILTPTYSRFAHLYYSLGLHFYDLLSGRGSLGHTRSLDRIAALALVPQLRDEALVGGVLYHDGQFDDARMNVLLVCTAVSIGAVAANRVEVTGLIKGKGRLAGVQAENHLGGGTITVRGKTVINACGPFSDALRALDEPDAAPIVRTSSGVHLVLSGGICPPDTGILIPKTEDGRVIFILPWMGRTLVGTTDEPAVPVENPVVGVAEEAYLLRHVRQYLSVAVGPSDVRSAWSGLRPLVRNPRARRTAELARTHVVLRSRSGLVSVVGGKWTTYRRIAAEVVGALLGTRPKAVSPPVLGAHGWSEQSIARLEGEWHLARDVAVHLDQSYGTRAEAVAALDAGGDRLVPSEPFLAAEVRWAVREEFALSVMDVLSRRMRIAFLDRSLAHQCVPRVAAIVGEELALSPQAVRQEIDDAHRELDTSI